MVDLCSPLCGVARAKAAQNGWSNVEVVEGDACTFQPEKKATVVTFSYSLSSEYPFRLNEAGDHHFVFSIFGFYPAY